MTDTPILARSVPNLAEPANADTVRKSGGRNPALDVLRCLAIILVVNGHTAGSLAPHPDDGYALLLQRGGIGVDLFFVLSGWLLGRQLCMELAETSTIDIRRFWYRRWLRTLPAYYAVLFFTFLWQIVLKGNWNLHWSYLVFLQNYLTNHPYFGVSWSLCVEEHFYLLIAPVLLLSHRLRSLAGALLVLLVIPFVCRTMGWYANETQTHIRYDPCIVGVILAAISVFSPRVWSTLSRMAFVFAAVGAVALCGDVLSRFHIGPIKSGFGYLTLGLIFGSWVLLAVSNRRFREASPIPGARYLADRSYAVYLLHDEALAIMGRLTAMPFMARLVLTWALSLIFAEVLYRWIELPFMQMRERIRSARSRV